MNLHPGVSSARESKSRRGGTARLSAAGAVLMVTAATVGWAFDDNGPSGLNGIFENEIPFGLTADEFNVLGPNWEAWAEETAGLVDDFYVSTEQDVAAQRAALAKLNVKLDTMEKALGESKYRMIHGQLLGLHGRLQRRVQLAEAILDTLEAAPTNNQEARVAAAYANVTDAVLALEQDLRRVPDGSAWLPYVRAEQLKTAAASNDTSDEAIERALKVQRKIAGRNDLDGPQRDFLGRSSFLNLEEALSGLLAANQWAPPENQNAAVREQAAKLVSAIETYEVDASDEAAARVNAAYQELKGIANDGGERISAMMRRHYFGYNLRLIASEGFMRRVISDRQTDASYINEPTSEAWITGTSCTYTDVSVDLQPNPNVAQFNIVISGTVNATTTANAAQAVVYGGSNGNFTATKPVYFSGTSFRTDPARVSANASVYTTDVDAKVFFLLRPIADLIAENEVAKRQYEMNATARQRIIDQASREVNSETDRRFNDATVKLEADTFGPLRELGWYPDSMQTSSTSTAMTIRGRVMEPQELAGQAPAVEPNLASNGLAIQVHESLLNNGADRLELAGKTMTDQELKALMEQRISTLLGREFHFSSPDEGAPQAPAPADAPAEEETVEDAGSETNTYVFDTHDPLRFQIENGTLVIILRTGLKREGQEDIPTHVIEVPLKFSVSGDQIVMQREGSVRVVPAPGTPRSIPRQNIMRANIQRSIPERTFDGKINIEQENKKITLNVSSIEARNGWLTVLAN